MNYYERHLGDYAKDAGHLSLLEHGAYTLLLDRYYSTEAPIGQADVYRVCRASSRPERQAVESVLREFFALAEDGWRHKRCDEEIARFRAKSEKARRSASARWDASPKQSERNANASPIAMRTHSEGNALQTPDSRHQTSLSTNPLGSSCVISSFPVEKIARAEEEASAELARLKAAYPPHPGRTDWITAEHHIRRHVEAGAAWDALHEGVRRYADHVRATGRLVLNPARFFGDADRPWSQAWPIPPTKAQATQDSNIAAARAWLEGTHAGK